MQAGAGEQVKFFQLVANNAEGEGCAEDRCLYIFKQIWQGADMVFVGVKVISGIT
jgi:hypothetical protein